MNLKVIAHARNGHTDKFGIPRQSREESPILTRIVFEPEYAVREALRGIEGYSHLWLIWGFSEVQKERMHSEESLQSEMNSWSPTVRPPRLGGNKRMGVFATRSPFRPNPIGLSSVRLVGVEENNTTHALELVVSGADVMDNTPIYDIKPYLSFSDSHEEAQNGFAEEAKDYHLEVDWTKSGPDKTPIKPRQNHDKTPITLQQLKDAISYILSQDPRPAYQDDPERVYKIEYAGFRVSFIVQSGTAIVQKLEKM